jgi:hypothetical protein
MYEILQCLKDLACWRPKITFVRAIIVGTVMEAASLVVEAICLFNALAADGIDLFYIPYPSFVTYLKLHLARVLDRDNDNLTALYK